MFSLVLYRELQAHKRPTTVSVRSSSPGPPPYTPYEVSEAASSPVASSLSRSASRVADGESVTPRRAHSNPEASSSRSPFTSSSTSRSKSLLFPSLCPLPCPQSKDNVGLQPSLSPPSAHTHLDPSIAREKSFAPGRPYSRVSHYAHPFIIQSLSVDLADGFPHVELGSDYYRHSAIKHEDWQRFVDDTNARIEESACEDPVGYTEEARAYVAQWSAAFFEPRGLKVTLRPRSHEHLSTDSSTSIDDSLLQDTGPEPSPPSSPTLSSQSLFGDPHFPIDLIPTAWTSPKAAAVHTATRKIEEKLEREWQKHERRTQAARKKAEKMTQKLEKKERKQMKKRGKQEAKATRKEYKQVVTNIAGNYEHAPEGWAEIDEGCWELVVEYS